MSSYILIDSTYRDRNLNPRPTDITLYSSSSNSSIIIDPVCLGYPIYPFLYTDTKLTGLTSSSTVIIGNSDNVYINNFYTGYFLEIPKSVSTYYSTFSKIISYNGSTKTFTLETPLPNGFFANVSYRIRKEMPLIQFVASSTQTLTNEILLPVSNSFTYNKLSHYKLLSPNGDLYKIVNYNSITKTLIINEKISYTINQLFEIIYVNYDNFVSFDWSINQIVFNQPICYDISLINVTIPNVEILSGYGGTLINYPYIWIAFEPINSYSCDNFYTNIPTTRNKLFKAIISDTSALLSSSFLKLTGSGMVHSMKLIPNGSYRFSIYLPNDEVLIYQSDNILYREPNPLLQVSATFSITPSVNN